MCGEGLLKYPPHTHTVKGFQITLYHQASAPLVELVFHDVLRFTRGEQFIFCVHRYNFLIFAFSMAYQHAPLLSVRSGLCSSSAT